MDLLNEELRRQRYNERMAMLLDFQMQGVQILVLGKQFPLEIAAQIMTIHEDECYMPDPMWDSNGKLISINYDLVKLY